METDMKLTDFSLLKQAIKKVPSLNDSQLDGRTCVVCGNDVNDMVPIEGLHSDQSVQLFRCEACVFEKDI